MATKRLNGRRVGRPKKITTPIALELQPVQHQWLEQLIAQGCYGNEKEEILLGWIIDRFRNLVEANVLTSTGAGSEKNIVRMENPSGYPSGDSSLIGTQP